MIWARNLIFAIAVSSLSIPVLAKEMPPMPISMVGKITSPLAKIEFSDIKFSTGKSSIATSDSMRVADLSRQIQGLDVYVIVEAYSDSVGDEVSNQILSEARAASVRDAFIGLGEMAPTQVISVGYGEAFAKGGEESSRRDDRRVSITVHIPKKLEYKREEMFSALKKKGVPFQRLGASGEIAIREPTGTTIKKIGFEQSNLSLYLVPSQVLAVDSSLESFGTIGLEIEVLPLQFDSLSGIYLNGNYYQASAYYADMAVNISRAGIGAGYLMRLTPARYMIVTGTVGLEYASFSFAEISESTTTASVMPSPLEAGSSEIIFPTSAVAISTSAFVAASLPGHSFMPGLGIKITASQYAVLVGVLIGIEYSW